MDRMWSSDSQHVDRVITCIGRIDMMTDSKTQKTHSEKCWQWHYECFKRKIREAFESYVEEDSRESADDVWQSLAEELWDWLYRKSGNIYFELHDSVMRELDRCYICGAVRCDHCYGSGSQDALRELWILNEHGSQPPWGAAIPGLFFSGSGSGAGRARRCVLYGILRSHPLGPPCG